jgi:hypothetical protein
VFFDGTHERDDGFVIDNIGDGIPEDVLNGLPKHDDLTVEGAKKHY